MAQEERLLILQMVADKKITAAEGVELLRALDAKEKPAAAPMAPVPPIPPTPPMAPEPPAAPHAPHMPHQGGANVGSGFSSFIEDIVDRVSSAFSEAMEPRYEFTYELTGEFPGVDVVPLRIQTGNGKADIQAWDEPGWKAVILVKARGNNEEEARNRANEAYTVKSTNGFDLEDRKHDWTAVNVTLYVPRGLRYAVDTRTGNGRVEIHNIDMTQGRVTTGNGRLVCAGGSAERLAIRSGNGSIEIDGNFADVEASSGNGSVTVRPQGQRSETYRVSTGNGSVKVETTAVPAEAGFKVEAHTGMGGIHLALPGLTYDRDVRTVGHKQIIARSANFEQAAVKVMVVARTGMGSVSVG